MKYRERVPQRSKLKLGGRPAGAVGVQEGYTIVELVIGMTVFVVIALSAFTLYSSLVSSAVLAKQKAVALSLGTNQMEYLKSLPYNNLAVAGGSIVTANPIPATSNITVNNVLYVVKTDISYTDDAFDGCGSYPNLALKQQYCRNYPAPAGAPATDTNPADYKIAHVAVYTKSNIKLAEVDTEISARVAETASTTGALFVSVLDDDGNPVVGALVHVTDTTLNPSVNVSDNTDTSGNAIFYGLPPDTTGYDYVVTASNTGYSTLTTIAPSGSLQPTYPSKQIFTQLSSFVTLTLKPQGTNSLVLETTDASGNPLGSMKVYVKGGYKKYTNTADTSYYYDTLSPTDTRPQTDGGGFTSLSNLVPGNYIFCGDTGSSSCGIGGTPYYLAAAVPYGGLNSLDPITVPTYDAGSPPTQTFTYNGQPFLQKVRLIMTNNINFPRIFTLNPSELSLASATLNPYAFVITGANLPCNTSGGCSTTVRFTQGSNTYTATCNGNGLNTQLNCTANLTGITAGNLQLTIIANGFTLNLPDTPLLGGLNAVP
ncbi:MAG: hypothetical protein JWS12_121 [Candidatus Saccharibacteria bacterium]|nr:hypothetical protein [Candidatus Saccharibacteria bacterium]